MGSLIRAMDWAKTPLGGIDGWPQSLRTAVSLCISSTFPISLAWGPSHIQIYNDGYWPICATKHPHSMGQDFSECWASAWSGIGEAFESALNGQAAYLENQPMFLDRLGYLEETFFTFSFSPIRDETGSVGGLFHPVTEMTSQILSARRARTMRDLAERTVKGKTLDDVFHLAAETLAGAALDLPFALFYQIDNGTSARLVAGCGLPPGTDANPERIDLDATSGWPLSKAMGGEVVRVDDVPVRVPCGPYPESPRTAFLVPLKLPGAGQPIGILVAGVSTRLPLSEMYRTFLEQIAATVTTSLAGVCAVEHERQRAEALAAINAAKTEFFSNVSHEFRTPLTLMLGPIEDALADTRGELPALQRGRLEMARGNAHRLLKLVNTLLDFSRFEARGAAVAYRPTDLARLTAALASHFEFAAAKAGLRLVVDCPELAEPVFVDRDAWEGIVLNLVSNALKFTFRGEIAVGLRMAGREAVLTVRDTGTGIPRHELPRLFERFHRVEGTRGRTHEGSGIGLALVDQLVRQHGGSIEVCSVEGEGTAFLIRLPLGSDHLAPEQIRPAMTATEATSRAGGFVEEALRWLPDAELPDGAPAVAARAAAAGAYVLLVDDNADMRGYVGRILRESGYHVLAVADGGAALAAARGPRRPDVVVTDVMMPVLDGFGLLRALRDDPNTAGILVILLSARAGPEARMEGLAAGADEYICKPFSAAELLARLDGAVRLDRMRRDAGSRENDLRTELALQQGRAALHESEQDHRYSIELSPQMPWTKDPAGNILDISRRWLDLTGMDREAAVSLGWSLLLHPDDAPRAAALWARSVRTGEAYDAECRIRVADGSFRWVRARAYARRDENGKIIRWYGTTEDVNDRVAAEIHTRELERRHALVLQSMTVGVYDLDMRTGAVHWSPHLKEMFGIDSATDPTREDIRSRLHPDDRERVLGMWDANLAGPFVVECRMLGAHGRYLRVSVTCQVECDDAGRAVHAVGSVDDITARRQAEERFRLVVEFSSIAKVVTDEHGSIVLVNRQIERLFGYGRDELLGRKVELLIPDRFRAQHPENRARFVAEPLLIEAETRAMSTADEIFGRRKDGSEFPVEIGLIPMEADDGLCILACITDVTQLRAAEAASRSFQETLERQVAERTAQLVAANKELDEFAFVASHDLKAPLRVIANTSKWLEEDLQAHLNDDTRENMALLRSRVMRMEKLLNDLLDYSRIGHSGAVVRMERVSGSEIMEGVLALLALPASFEVGVGENFAAIRVDRMPLQQVLLNLISNARKHHDKAAGRIDVTVEDCGAHYAFCVADDGPGIAAAFHEQIFGLFQTLKPRDLVEGSGMGLAMVRKYVNSQGGVLTLKSSEGHGSQFQFTWPKGQTSIERSHDFTVH